MADGALGIAQLVEFVLDYTLFLSREAIRLTIAKLPKSLESTRSQWIINYSYSSFIIYLFFGLPIIYWKIIIYYNNLNDLLNLIYPLKIYHIVLIILICVILELLAEPYYNLNQFIKLDFKTRTKIESWSNFIKCIIQFLSIILIAPKLGMSKTNINSYVFGYLMGQLSYSLSIYLLYWKSFSFNILIPSKIISNNNNNNNKNDKDNKILNSNWFEKNSFSYFKSIFIQQIFKNFLTVGDKFVITSLLNIQIQGYYSFISNYGSLIARILFAPMEESTRISIGLLFKDEKNLKNDFIKFSQYISNVLKIYIYILTLLIIFAPLNTKFLLNLIFKNFNSNDLILAFKLYWIYIILLASNGILEALFQSLFNSNEIVNKYSFFMLINSIIFLSSLILLISKFNQGLNGLLYANMINMIMRIIYCYFSIKSFILSKSKLTGLKFDYLNFNSIVKNFNLFLSSSFILMLSQYIYFQGDVKTWNQFALSALSGDLTPGISAKEYYQRRLKLAEKLPKGSIAILPGSSVKFASGSVFYQFQQNTDLYYLTGWNEPDSVAIIERPKNSDDPIDHIFHMAVPDSDPSVEQWEGERTGVKGVQEIFNADISVSIQQFPSHLDKILRNYTDIYYDIGGASSASGKSTNFFEKMFPSIISNDSSSNNKLTNRANIEEILRKHSNQGFSIKPLASIITNLRVIKSNSELKLMRLAGKISGHAYNEAYAKKFKSEKGLHSFLEYRFISGGCDKSAYFPVVAGGSHALCIHYVRNDDLFKDGDMVLVDAAGNLGGYCADISRTWPVNGEFSPAQTELYEALLSVQRRIIRECQVNKGNSLNDLHNLSVDLLTLELRNIGFNDLQSWEVSKYLYPHYIGHNLGLDVHDCPLYSRSAQLRKGQVVTVEPGVYVPNDERWPSEFRGMGIRIEDDVAVGDDVHVVLTAEAAKEIVDIENIARNGVTTKLLEEVTDIYSL
ncbi:hypothetical protein C6P42_001191 [Pichia californica]|nr:hypothetical protein C6P42_001191 [[Candida] californica]